MEKIEVVGNELERIEIAGNVLPKVEQEEVGKALGAEPYEI